VRFLLLLLLPSRPLPQRRCPIGSRGRIKSREQKNGVVAPGRPRRCRDRLRRPQRGSRPRRFKVLELLIKVVKRVVGFVVARTGNIRVFVVIVLQNGGGVAVDRRDGRDRHVRIALAAALRRGGSDSSLLGALVAMLLVLSQSSSARCCAAVSTFTADLAIIGRLNDQVPPPFHGGPQRRVSGNLFELGLDRGCLGVGGTRGRVRRPRNLNPQRLVAAEHRPCVGGRPFEPGAASAAAVVPSFETRCRCRRRPGFRQPPPSLEDRLQVVRSSTCSSSANATGGDEHLPSRLGRNGGGGSRNIGRRCLGRSSSASSSSCYAASVLGWRLLLLLLLIPYALVPCFFVFFSSVTAAACCAAPRLRHPAAPGHHGLQLRVHVDDDDDDDDDGSPKVTLSLAPRLPSCRRSACSLIRSVCRSIPAR
jgi:hypothetical protein